MDFNPLSQFTLDLNGPGPTQTPTDLTSAIKNIEHLVDTNINENPWKKSLLSQLKKRQDQTITKDEELTK